MDDLLAHLFLGSVVFVFLRQDHRESAGSASRNDGDLVHRIRLRQAVRNNCVSRFVERGQLAFVLADDTTLLFRSRDDLRNGFFDFFHADDHAVPAGCQQRRFIQHVLDIRRREARCPPRQHDRVDALIQRLVARVDFKYLFSSDDVRNADDDLPVESARSQKRRVQYVRTVRRCQDDDAGVLRESIHLDKQLVERLLTFVMAAAKSGATFPSYRIDLIDEDDARRVLLRLLEQVTDTGCADTDEHLHEVRTADRKERNTSFAGRSL